MTYLDAMTTTTAPAPRFQLGERIAFERPGPRNLGPVFGTVIEVHALVNGSTGFSITWREELDGTHCTHPENDPRLRFA